LQPGIPLRQTLYRHFPGVCLSPGPKDAPRRGVEGLFDLPLPMGRKIGQAVVQVQCFRHGKGHKEVAANRATTTTRNRLSPHLMIPVAARRLFGAHFVKTYYCEDFEKVVEGCPVPVVIAGGPKLDTMRDVFQLTHDALSRGAVGVDMGRNIWQSDHPVAAIRGVRAIVHEKYTVKKALDLFNELKAKKK